MTGAGIRFTGVGRIDGPVRVSCLGRVAVGIMRTGLGMPDGRALGAGKTAGITRIGLGMREGRIRGAGAAQICIGLR